MLHLGNHKPIIQNFLSLLNATSGVIWNKELRIFIPLLNIPLFSDVKKKVLARSRLLETYNFHKEILKIVYYQEENIFMFEANDTKVSGTCGQIWTILSEYLNFTLVPLRSRDRGFGLRQKNNTYNGLLGIIQRKEAQIVPRSGIFNNRLNLMEFTVPLWTTRYRLFIRPEWKHDEAWVFHIFSLNVWISILAIFIILSFASYTLQTIVNSSIPNGVRYSLQDHFFNTMALMCSQGSIPDNIYNRFKILSLCESIFSWMILIALGAHSITRMMNRTLIPPFTDLESLMKNTKYEITAFEGSMVREEFQKEISHVNHYNKGNKRIFLAPSSDIMYKSACFSKSKFALFDAEDRHKAIGRNYCRLIPSGTSYYETWIASGIVRGFKFKRTLDIGLMKLDEFGLIDGLKDRWLNWKLDDKIDKHFESIDTDQVYLNFLILLGGMFASVLIALTEYVAYIVNSKQKIRSRKIKAKCNVPKLSTGTEFNRAIQLFPHKK